MGVEGDEKNEYRGLLITAAPIGNKIYLVQKEEKK
jgi:hypothetical protein